MSNEFELIEKKKACPASKKWGRTCFFFVCCWINISSGRSSEKIQIADRQLRRGGRRRRTAFITGRNSCDDGLAGDHNH